MICFDEIFLTFDFLAGQLWKLIKLFKEHKLANYPNKLYSFIREQLEIAAVYTALQDSETLTEVIVDEDDKTKKKRKSDDDIETIESSVLKEDDSYQKKLKVDDEESQSMTIVEKLVLSDALETSDEKAAEPSSTETPKAQNKITNYFNRKS